MTVTHVEINMGVTPLKISTFVQGDGDPKVHIVYTIETNVYGKKCTNLTL